MRKLVVVILSAMCVNAPAFELALTEAEKTMCEAEGGCVVISRLMVGKMLGEAHKAGMAACERKI